MGHGKSFFYIMDYQNLHELQLSIMKMKDWSVQVENSWNRSSLHWYLITIVIKHLHLLLGSFPDLLFQISARGKSCLCVGLVTRHFLTVGKLRNVTWAVSPHSHIHMWQSPSLHTVILLVVLQMAQTSARLACMVCDTITLFSESCSVWSTRTAARLGLQVEFSRAIC